MMYHTGSGTVAALFEDETAAVGAIAELHRLGLAREAIAVGTRSGKRMEALAERFGATRIESATQQGGVLASLARITGAGDDETQAALTEDLMARGVDEERARYFAGNLTEGRVLVVLAATDVAPERLAVLTGAHADLGLANGPGRRETVPLRREFLDVSKRVVVTNEVIVRTEIVSERKVVEVELEREELVIERRNLLDAAAPPLVTRIPIKHEEIVVAKETVVTDEVLIRTEQFVSRERVDEVVRHEVLHVDEPAGGPELGERARSHDRDPVFGAHDRLTAPIDRLDV